MTWVGIFGPGAHRAGCDRGDMARGAMGSPFESQSVRAEFRSSHAWDACYTHAQIPEQSVPKVLPSPCFPK